MAPLTGRVAIVTGAGRGIGRAVALALAKEGAAVGLAAKTASEIETVAEEIQVAGGRALAVPADVGAPDDVAHLIQSIASWQGPVDILVNNAGIASVGAFVQNVELRDFEEVLRVNLFGTFLCVRGMLPSMIEQRWGRIINLSGRGAWTGIRGGAPYAVSKSAVEGLTRTIAQEVQRFGVTCNAIQPGRVETRNFALSEAEHEGRASEIVGPEHAGRCIAWLCTDDAAEITGWTIDAVDWDRRHTSGAAGRVAAQAAALFST